MAIRLPKRHRQSLSFLMSKSHEERKKFAEVLGSVPAATDLETLASELNKATSIERAAARGIVRMLFTLYSARAEAGVSADRMAEDVLDAAPGELESPSDRSVFRSDLVALLSLEDTLGVTARALEVMHQHEHLYCSSRLFTDVRPIFDAADAGNLTGAVVLHNLRLTYHDGDNTYDFFLALDRRDVEELRDILNRALEKEGTARAMIRKAGVPDYDPEPHR